MILNPKITVLMPVYNCELYIREAVDSILNQTFGDFEFLIIDDASTDNTATIIKEYDDPRIQLIEKPLNTGLTNSLNFGLKIAKGEYIARMDGDDISLPERFEKQVAFLDANPEVVLCGSLYQIIGTNKVCNHPLTHEEIKVMLISGSCIGHPTVMFRSVIFEKNKLEYNPQMEPAEDYDLWSRLIFLGRIVNIGEVLLHYRVHSTQVSQKRREQQINNSIEVKIGLINNLDYEKSTQTQGFLNKIISRKSPFSFKEMEYFQDFKNKLIEANKQGVFEKVGFEKYLLGIQRSLFKKYFLSRDKYTPLIYFQYLKLKNSWKSKLQWIDEIKLFVKSMIFYKK